MFEYISTDINWVHFHHISDVFCLYVRTVLCCYRFDGTLFSFSSQTQADYEQLNGLLVN